MSKEPRECPCCKEVYTPNRPYQKYCNKCKIERIMYPKYVYYENKRKNSPMIQLTIYSSKKKIIKTPTGDVSFESWVKREKERFEMSGIKCEIVRDEKDNICLMRE